MPTFHTLDKGGVDKLLAAIGPEIKSPGRKVVGIVVDANDDLTSRWNAVADKLKEANIQPPSVPHDDGTIICEIPRIGIWLMPNNQSSGELEDFVGTMIPPEDPVWPLSGQYIDKIPVAARKFAADKALRAKLYAWLATREAPAAWVRLSEGDISVLMTDPVRLSSTGFKDCFVEIGHDRLRFSPSASRAVGDDGRWGQPTTEGTAPPRVARPGCPGPGGAGTRPSPD